MTARSRVESSASAAPGWGGDASSDAAALVLALLRDGDPFFALPLPFIAANELSVFGCALKAVCLGCALKAECLGMCLEGSWVSRLWGIPKKEELLLFSNW